MEMKISRNRIVCVLLSVLMIFGLFVAVSAQDTTAANTTGFYVDGTTIRDANGNEFIMRGVNHAYAWYKKEIETAIKASAELGCNTVRIVVSDGQKYTKTTAEEIEMLTLMCMNYKVVPIFDVHDITGNNSTSKLNKTVNYWISLKDVLQKYEKYVIVNIANEWMGQWGNGSGWSIAYQTAIQNIRDAGIMNMIVVDAPGWGQDGGACGDYCKEVFDADVEKNTIFSIHMYGSAGGKQSTIKSNIDGVLDDGVPVIIGEFGYYHSDGDVDEEYIMEYCTEKNVGYIGWSWKGNGGGVEYLDIAVEWDGSVLSSDWGENLFNGENGIKATSEVCSIFTDGSTPEVSIPDAPESSEEESSVIDESTADSSVADTEDSSVPDDSSVSDSDSSTDSGSDDTQNDSTAGSVSTGGTSNSGSTGSSTSGSSTNTSTNKDVSTNTGASALAFVGLALAGVAVVVTKKTK